MACKFNLEGVLAKVNAIDRAKYDLPLRDSQVIKRDRNEVSVDSLLMFLYEYMKHIIKRNASPNRLFNMVETGFSQENRLTEVIVVEGLWNVWSKSAH
ncbi:unnamed protein product [Hyaloperonospora brassicae]|uniref:Uncharacterized protein n=1 Tax=Hyaloperonospora brassicae TaxID=162125 RepID=A0AAV0UPP2_HYABA|nr:unnamed protein product [Hyaloperonospora brassicae]